MKSTHLRFGIMLLISVFVLATIASAASSPVIMYLFHGNGCPHCESLLSTLDDLKSRHPTLKVVTFEVYGNDENRQLFEQATALYNRSIEGVPTVFIGSSIIVGYNTQIAGSIEAKIAECEKAGCIDPLETLRPEAPVNDTNSTLPPPAPSSGSSLPLLLGIAALVAIGAIIFILARGTRDA
jgi:glutaredoxin